MSEPIDGIAGYVAQMSRLDIENKALQNQLEALRAENAKLKDGLCQPYVWADEATPFTGKEVKELLSKNAKLRGWAKFILDNHDKFVEHDPDGVKEYTLANLAAALKENNG